MPIFTEEHYEQAVSLIESCYDKKFGVFTYASEGIYKEEVKIGDFEISVQCDHAYGNTDRYYFKPRLAILVNDVDDDSLVFFQGLGVKVWNKDDEYLMEKVQNNQYNYGMIDRNYVERTLSRLRRLIGVNMTWRDDIRDSSGWINNNNDDDEDEDEGVSC